MKILPMIQRCTRVSLPQSLNRKAPISEPRCGVPQQRFMLGMLAALGVFLSLGSAGVAQPVITTAPTNLTVCLGSPALFSADASGDPNTMTYQWQLSVDGGTNFTDINGETSASYTLPVTASGDNGNQYQVIVIDANGSVTSTPPAVLTVITPPTADAGTNQTSCGTNCIA